ncbi:hypothetical protein LWI29_014944 [Acer saccharum]|uniref:Delta(3)-Delta(2)-enoyl-CoA isomerase n=1 Tax=Acer saccharum TaxID=4024 RepID=A0AA39SJN9_ACESA|nr:hypothetical protein LWI29_014944 [Acer saccharum]KAK1570543.1 hypothetical protein Q3G72_003452 [Acer saccharum]
MCSLEKRGSLYILTLVGPGEHRLNPALLDAIHSALRRVKAESTSSSSLSSPSSSALITTAEGKFFSNGYDLAWAQSKPSQFKLMSLKLRSVVAEFISLPMPTIAAITGHTSAAGVILALSHDYVLMRRDRGFLYMSELDIGLKIPAWFMALIGCKIGEPAARRELVLRAAKLTAKEAVEKGIIDSAHDSAEETVKAAVAFGEELVMRKWDGHVYAQIRMVVLREVLDKLGSDETVDGLTTTGSKL